MKKDVYEFFLNDLGLGMEDADPLYQTFLESFGEIASELRQTRPDDEMALRRITHSIIGFSQNVGANDLFEAAMRLNAAAKAGDVPACSSGAEEILALYDAYSA